MRYKYMLILCLLYLTFVHRAYASETTCLSLQSAINIYNRECHEKSIQQKSIMHYAYDSYQNDTIKKKSYAVSLGLTSIPIVGPLPSRMYIARNEKRDEMRKIILKGLAFSTAELFCTGLFYVGLFSGNESIPKGTTIIGIFSFTYAYNIIDTYYTVNKVNARIEKKKIDVSISSFQKSPMLCISLKF